MRETGSQVFEVSVAIPRPPGVVYAFLADVQDAEPIPRRATVRMVKEPTAPTGVGTRWHESVRLAPACWLHIQSVVTEAQQPVRLGMDFSTRWFTGHLTYDIVPDRDGSVLYQRETLQPRPYLRWLGPLIGRRLLPHLRQRLADISEVLQTTNPDVDGARRPRPDL